MLYISLAIIFISIYLVLLGIFKIIFKERLTLLSRLGMFGTTTQKKRDSIDEELSKPFFERAIRPILFKLAQLTTRAMPAKKKVSLQKKLLMAGNPFELTPNEFMAIQYSFMVGLPLLSVVITLPFGWPITKMALVAIVAVIMGQLIPEYYLKLKAKNRQEEIQKNLPDVLDLLTVSVEAGLGFDAALVKVIEKIKGVLSVEFSRVLQEIKMGKPRRDALRDLGFRTGVDDLTAFIGAIIQADQLGVSIGNVLRLQSEQMRIKRRQRAEEKAMKAPIKILIPLLFFIFPTIFIVLLGPALIQFLDTVSR